MNAKLKLMGAALPLSLLLGAALSPAAMAAQVGQTGPVGPVPFEAWQGWYEYNTYSWHNGTYPSAGWMAIISHRVYVGGTSQNECNVNLSSAMSGFRITAWNACYRL